MAVRYVSTFSGIGGLDLGFDRAGLECAAQVEINPKCRAVLEEHWPKTPRYHDIKTVGGKDVEGRATVLCGGPPCQDLSLAGKRAGLAGERSGLFSQFARIAAELSPDIICIENVVGLLSSNGGRDMGTVLGKLGELGYGWAYRVLDARYFGVPQRRRRVIIVGCLGDAARAAEILFESDSVQRHPKPRRNSRRGDTGAVTAFRWHVGTGSLCASDEVCPPLDLAESPAVYGSFGIRRFTPLECERLQGFPDNWTASADDSARYDMLGNAVAVPVAEWIARRMAAVLRANQ
jgi:DNA (cytosine-5)-methyltransferase 1